MRSRAKAASRPADRLAAAVSVLAIAVPSIVVLVGAAGSGKSTLASALFDPDEVLSSDTLREAVSGDAADQRATRIAFSILHREAARRLAARRLVVVDATNVERHARLGLVRLARAAGAPAIAIVLAADPATTHLRNATRPGRVVPPAVVDRHLAALAGLGDRADDIVTTLRIEGFAAVHVVGATDAQLTIERRATASAG